MKQFTGTGVAIVTPFTTDGSIDVKALHKITNHLIHGGVEYLVVLGSTGEAATQSDEDQHITITAVQDANQGRLPIVLGVGGNDTRSAARKAEAWTRKYNPDGFLSVSPMYNKPSQEGIYQHFSAIAQSTSKPIILYNVPSRTGSNMLAETTLRIAKDHQNIVGIKEASGNMEQCMGIVHDAGDGFTSISGDDALTLPLMSVGFQGAISVIANAVPRPFSDMVRAAQRGDFALAKDLHYKILNLMQLSMAEGNPTSIKVALEVLGLCDRTTRLPLMHGSDALAAKFRTALSAL